MPRFVIQKHDATHLHYDFRLEMDGVLKSWAVPKEPPRTSEEKRLAVAVPDHELSYINFEGNIEEGSYGAGKVAIWDKGTYSLESKDKSKIVFKLKGKKLKGKYALIKTSFGKDSWLFLKMKEDKNKI